MNQRAVIGGNFPPDPIDEAVAPFADVIAEAEGWLDGTPVENEAQMAVVDGLLAEIKAALKAVSAGEESEAKPLHDAWKAAKGRWKPTIDDLDRIKKGLIAAVDGFKRRLAAEKAEAARKAQEEAAAALAASQAAHAAAEASNIEAQRAAAEASNIEAQRAAAEAAAQAESARIKAAVAAKDTVKGTRLVHRYDIEDPRAALHFIARTDRPAMDDFIQDYVRRHYRDKAIDGVRVWQEKEAF